MLNPLYSKNLSKLGSDKFVQFSQVFGLHRFILHRHLVDGTVKSVWFRKIFGLTRVHYYNDKKSPIHTIPLNKSSSLPWKTSVRIIFNCKI